MENGNKLWQIDRDLLYFTFRVVAQLFHEKNRPAQTNMASMLSLFPILFTFCNLMDA